MDSEPVAGSMIASCELVDIKMRGRRLEPPLRPRIIESGGAERLSYIIRRR